MTDVIEFEVFSAVAAVISAFHGGAELLARINKRRTRENDVQTKTLDRKQVQISLETAELQVGFRFSVDEARFGDTVRVGDAIARNRLLQIAVVIQTDIIMILQLAAKYEDTVIDFKKLHTAAVANRRDAIDALDELKRRILVQRPSSCPCSGSPDMFGDDQGFPKTAPASRTPSEPVSEEFLPDTVSRSDNGDSKNDLSASLVRYFYEQRRGRAVSNTANYFHLLDSAARDNNFRPALRHLLQGKSSKERALIMKDIDEIIAAYQGLRIEGDRADALAKLTGNEESSKRDTLFVLQGGFGRLEDVKTLHQNAPQLLKELPPLPKSSDTQYPAYIHNVINNDDDRRLSEWVERQQRQQRQHVIPTVSRWSTTSTGSSASSEHTLCSSDPPSLYFQDSRSPSRASTASPTTQFFPSHHANSTCSTKPFWSFGTAKNPPNNSSLAASRADSPMRQTTSRSLASSRANSPMRQVPSHSAASSRANSPIREAPSHSLAPSRGNSPMRYPPSRSLTPTSAAQRPRTPISNSRDASPEPRGRSRVHLLPTDDWRYNNDASHRLHPLRSQNSPSQLSLAPSSSQISVTTCLTQTSTTSSFKSTITTAAREKMMKGRPCKDNNYWGFCKGAWATREDIKKGLVVTAKPEGMFTTKDVWQCKHCLFEGPSFTVPHRTKKNKKEVVVNPNVYVSAAGVRYRWSFLAKSHVKKISFTSGSRPSSPSNVDAECNYGCVICSVEGNVSGIYGNVETLMSHVAHEHVWDGGMSDAVMMRSKLVVGRVAGSDEEWDINIPGKEVLLF